MAGEVPETAHPFLLCWTPVWRGASFPSGNYASLEFTEPFLLWFPQACPLKGSETAKVTGTAFLGFWEDLHLGLEAAC